MEVMRNSLVYVLRGIGVAVFRFFYHWYVFGFHAYWHAVVRFIFKLDRRFAFKVTLLHLFKPLYQDYSFLGYVLGIFFRIIRLVIGGVVYIFILIVSVFGYLIWIIIPPALLFKIFQPI